MHDALVEARTPFPLAERTALPAVMGVRPTVVARLEQLGFASLAQLAEADAADVVAGAAALLGSSCWRNSPQALAAIEGAIAVARVRAVGGSDPEEAHGPRDPSSVRS
jgi:hypothetical protein